MELGACICTVHQPPACNVCPIRAHCRALRDLQDFEAQGGDLTGVDAPLVSQYPAKASHCSLISTTQHPKGWMQHDIGQHKSHILPVAIQSKHAIVLLFPSVHLPLCLQISCMCTGCQSSQAPGGCGSLCNTIVPTRWQCKRGRPVPPCTAAKQRPSCRCITTS